MLFESNAENRITFLTASTCTAYEFPVVAFDDMSGVIEYGKILSSIFAITTARIDDMDVVTEHSKNIVLVICIARKATFVNSELNSKSDSTCLNMLLLYK